MTALASIGLMMRHEARINWRATATYASHKGKIISLIALVAFMHLFATAVPFVVAESPPVPRVTLLAGLTAIGLTIFVMMISATLIGTVRLIYSRGDMDLLMSSPIPPQSIVTVRILAIALGVLAIAGVFLLPLANMMAIFSHPRYLLGYVVLPALALAATAIGMLLAQGLFRVFGARRTRLISQILAAMIGGATVVAANIRIVLPDGTQAAAGRMLSDWAAGMPGADSLVWLPARAMLGEPLAVLVLTVACAGLFIVTTRMLADRLMANAIAANGTAANTVKTRSSRRLASKRGAVAVTRSKEWLLIARDPWLMTQMGKQIILTMPGLYVLWHLSGSPLAWLGVVLLVGQLAGMLTWLTVSTEDAPELLQTAPVSRVEMNWAKMQAALIPTAAIMAAPLAAGFSFGFQVGITVLLCSAANALCISVYHLRHAAPAKRSQIERRGSDKQLNGLYELFISVAWAGFGLAVLLLGWWGLLGVALLAPALYWMVLR